MNTTAGKLAEIVTIGATVIIPTTSWGTWTGEVLDTREAGPLARDGEFFVTLKDADGTVQEVRTSRLYSGYLVTPDEAPARIARPNLTISAESMYYAQAVKLTPAQLRDIAAWADDVEARRIARGDDVDFARPEQFRVPVRTRHDVLIGHMVYAI